MLPFLRPKSQPIVTEIKRKPDEGSEAPESSENQGLTSCAEDLITAVHNKDSKAVAAALKAAFEVCESYPHEEYHDFDSDGDTE